MASIFSRLKAGIDVVMIAVGYYPQDSVFALHQRDVEVLDQQRIAHEQAVSELINYELRLADIKQIRAECAQLTAQEGVPEEMLRHMLAKQDAIFAELTNEAERKLTARRRIQTRERDPATGRFLPAPKDQD